MGLPNIKFYYWTNNLRITQFWLQSDSFWLSSVWLIMEAASRELVSLSASAHSMKSSSSEYNKDIIVFSIIRLGIWRQSKHSFHSQTYSISAPLTVNHVFRPSLTGDAFQAWPNLGIKSFKYLYINKTFAPFHQLSDKVG